MVQQLELIDELNKIESDFQAEKARALQSHQQQLAQEKVELQSRIAEMQAEIKQIIAEIRQYTIDDVGQSGSMKPQSKSTIPKQSLTRFRKLVSEILSSSS